MILCVLDRKIEQKTKQTATEVEKAMVHCHRAKESEKCFSEEEIEGGNANYNFL